MSVLAGYMVPHPPLILPQVGRGEEAVVQKTIDSYRQVAAEIAEIRPETIIVSSPHTVMYSDYNHISPGRGAYGDMSRFGVPSLSLQTAYDEEVRQKICDAASAAGLRAGTLGERERHLDHGTFIPLWFVEQAYREQGIEPSYKVVRVGLSGQPLLEHYALGILIQKAVNDLGRRAVYIASGDLSHYLKEEGPYGFRPEGPEYDERIMDVMGRAAFGELFDFSPSLLEGAGECGHRSFMIMAGAFDLTAVCPHVYSHEGATGVGYGIVSFHPEGYDASRNFGEQYVEKHDAYLAERKANEDPYVQLARKTVETYVTEGPTASVDMDVPAEMKSERAGVFVSLHIDGNLRGCIGTISPVQENIAAEIISNAVSACSRDNRFDPVTEAELPFLEYSVDVLGPTEPISGPSELDVKRYGVIVSNRGRRGLLLPNLDGVRDVEQQISIARQKAGIRENEPIKLERFEVVRHY